MFERLLLTLGLTLLAVRSVCRIAYRHTCGARSPVAVAVGKPAILYFRSDACVPCSTQGRFLQQLQAEFGDRIVVEKVDADMEQARAERYGVFTLPTTLIVDPQGTVRHANYGLTDTRKLASQLRAVELQRAELTYEPSRSCRLLVGLRPRRPGDFQIVDRSWPFSYNAAGFGRHPSVVLWQLPCCPGLTYGRKA